MAVVLIYSVVLLPLHKALSGELSGRITGDGVTTRTGPGVEYEKVDRLHTGAQVTVVEESGKWLKVIDPDGREVWVFARWVELLSSEPEPGAEPSSQQEPELEETPPLRLEPELEEPPAPQPESEPKPRETRVASSVQESLAVEPPPLLEEKGGTVPWILIGAGATAAGVLGYLALSGEEKESDTGSLNFYVEFP
jgi:hypothetical protein